MSGESPFLVLGGRTGLLGQALTRALREAKREVLPVGREDFDPYDQDALRRFTERHGCRTVVNTVAYTAVDLAEEEPDNAFDLNERLPRLLGLSAAREGLRLVHFSTDFVFNGAKEEPYTTEDEPNPRSVYGQSKLAGERALFEAAPEQLAVIRTSWLFGPGKRNFVETILNLGANRPKLTVVADQFGSPTYTMDLARNTLRLLDAGGNGLFHLASCGKASWCELASEAVKLADLTCTVEPIPSSGWPQKAERPKYSVLDMGKFIALTGHTPRPWEQGLREYVFQELGLPNHRDD